MSVPSLGEAAAALFGHGDDDHPFWLLAVRLNVLLLVVALGFVGVTRVTRLRRLDMATGRSVLLAAGACSLVALALRLLVASNLLDQGGIPYSRMLLGYRGYFATAQVYSLFYLLSGRDIEHAILCNRLFGAATVPLLFALCRTLEPRSIAFPTLAAGLLALCPLHILFSGSDALSIFSGFLCVLSYLLVAAEERACLVAGALALALLTQVRYENVLLVVPALVFLALRRRRVPAAFCGATALFYAWPSLAAGISFQDHTRIADGLRLFASRAVLFNPLLAMPFLFLGVLLVVLARRPILFVFSLSLWAVAMALTVATAESPLKAARTFSNWLVPVAIAAGYGFALLAKRGRGARLAVGLLVVYFAAKPVLYAGALRTRYLEMAENDAFRALVPAQPAEAAAVIVPDDELLRRRSGATIETINKYLWIRRGLARPGAPVVGITELLEGTGEPCSGGRCVFFSGLPCTVESINSSAPAQCDAFTRQHARETLEATTVTAAPFESCAIFVGTLREELCAPALRTVTFGLDRFL